MSELPEGVAMAEPPAPRDSASAILIRSAPGGLEVLLGLRSRESRFMPAHSAFPGGAVDGEDAPERPGAFLRCVARELAEETGLAVGSERWVAAGERVTPPMFPVRFRTRFYVTLLDGKAPAPSPASAELDTLAFESPRAVVDGWRAGARRVPPPVLAILRALAAYEGRNEAESLARTVARANAREEREPRIEFVPGVWVLPVRTATLPPASHTNVWLPGGRRFVVVDPGSTESGEQARILRVIARRRALGHEPLAILLTHQHRDHSAGAAALARSTGLPLRAHPAVLPAVAAEGVEGRPLDEGETIDLEGLTLGALHTPGHAPGHLAFHLPQADTLVAGDLLSGVSTILIDPETGDMGQYLESLGRVQALAPRWLLPGHGPPLPMKALTRLIAHRREREARILAALSVPGTLESLARSAYGDLPQMPAALTQRQTLAHLLLLESRGTVRRAKDATWART